MRVFKEGKKRISSSRSFSKAQLSVFVIIGLVVVIVGSMLSYLIYQRAKGQAGKTAEELMATGVLPPLSVYVQSCIEKESPPAIFRLAEQGGVLEPKEGSYLYFNSTKLNYLCLVEGPSLEYSCVNAFLTRQEMQRILAKEIANNIRRCVNLKPFEAQGYTVETGKISVSTSVGKRSVLVDLNYPIKLTKENEVTNVTEFNAEVDIPLGELYELAIDITNKETSRGYFDIDRWVVDNGARIIIEKHRPYPDIIYILSEKVSERFKKGGIKFQFAVQNNPSIAQRIPKQKQMYGLCRNKYDDMCFENVQDVYCKQIEGIYNPATEIGCIENFKQPMQKPQLCNGHECRECKYDFWGKRFETPKKHGESWCAYDSITGKGYDYVGSRHYKHSCIDGNVYVEECRDYREEFCTESDADGMNRAVCRKNRWFDCSFCKTDQCCNDIRFRDCFWNFETSIKQKCVPYVPPGLRFWENEGMDICLRANNKMDCEGISCPNMWIDDAARYCYQQADCGNYRNIADEITYQGFFQTDPIDSVRDNIFLPKGWNRNPLKDGSYWSINLPLEVKEYGYIMMDAEVEVRSGQTTARMDYPTPVGNLPLLLSAAFEFIDEIVNLDISDFLNPFAPRPRIHIVDLALCSVWTAPTKKNYCVLCNADLAKPCTEYRCKSLGERCQFRMEKGMPICELPSLSDKEAPKIEFNDGALTKGYTAEKTGLAGNPGVKITPMIRPHKPFSFGIKTSEDARCRLKLSPRFGYFSLPSFWFNDPSFKTEHNLTLRMPPRLSIPQKLLDFLNLTSTSDIIPLLENLGPTYEYYKQRLRDKLQLYTTITGQDIIAQIDPAVNNAIALISKMTPYIKAVVNSMLEEFTKGGYYIFIECADRAGNTNKDEFFVQFEVDANYVDKEPPVIVYANPPNNSEISRSQGQIDLSLYVDEPAECRYSYAEGEFADMKNNFKCNTGYHISPVAGGTYECTAPITSGNSTRLFIRCRDNPPTTELYQLNVVLGNESKVIGIERYNLSNLTNITTEMYVNVTGSSIEAPAKMIEDFGFKIKQFPAKLRIYLPESMDCRFSNLTESFRDMEGRFGKCRISESIERGMYECDAELQQPSVTDVALGNLTLNVKKADDYGLTSGYLSENADVNVEPGKIEVVVEGKMLGEGNINMNSEGLVLNVDISGEAECRYREDNGAFRDMVCNPEGNRTICTQPADVSDGLNILIQCTNTTKTDEKSYLFYVGCSDVNATEGNANNESYVYVTQEAEPLNMTVKPSGVISEKEADLIVKVSASITENRITCGYNDNPFYGMLNMDKVASDRFGAHITGLENGRKYRYYVQCYDRYENEAEGYTEFEVVI